MTTHAKGVTEANAAKDKAIRDANYRENYLKALADLATQYSIDVETHRKAQQQSEADAGRDLAKAQNAAENVRAKAVAAAQKDLEYATAAAEEAKANGEATATRALDEAIADADEILANDHAAADAALWIAEAAAENTLAKATSAAEFDLTADVVSEQVALISILGNELISFMTTTAGARAAAFSALAPSDPDQAAVGGAWETYEIALANAGATAMNTVASAWAAYMNGAAAAAKVAADAEADAAEARAIQLAGDYQTSVAQAAAAEKVAAKAVAGEVETATIAMNAAARAHHEASADAAKAYADASADASKAGADAEADAHHAYIVNALPAELAHFTATANAANARQKDGIAATAQAMRDGATAAHTRAIAELSSTLTATNAAAPLDDPIAVAAAEKDKADTVLAAQQELAGYQARAASTFAGMGPGNSWVTTFFSGIGYVGSAIGSFLGHVGETFMDGRAWDSLQGAFTEMVDIMTFGLTDFSEWWDPLYGNETVHHQGTYVGMVWGYANWIAITFGRWAPAPAGSGTVMTHWGPSGMTAFRTGDWVMKGSPNLMRYLLSGVIQPGRHFAWPWNFIVGRAAPGTLRSPGGWEAIKWILGQRIYIP